MNNLNAAMMKIIAAFLLAVLAIMMAVTLYGVAIARYTVVMHTPPEDNLLAALDEVTGGPTGWACENNFRPRSVVDGNPVLFVCLGTKETRFEGFVDPRTGELAGVMTHEPPVGAPTRAKIFTIMDTAKSEVAMVINTAAHGEDDWFAIGKYLHNLHKEVVEKIRDEVFSFLYEDEDFGAEYPPVHVRRGFFVVLRVCCFKMRQGWFQRLCGVFVGVMVNRQFFWGCVWVRLGEDCLRATKQSLNLEYIRLYVTHRQ